MHGTSFRRPAPLWESPVNRPWTPVASLLFWLHAGRPFSLQRCFGSADPMILKFDSIARLPAPGDNVAIASRRLEPGMVIDHVGQTFAISHAILEGHRFAIAPIPKRGFLLSWALPFGVALRDIAPGEYVCNERILVALAQRRVEFTLPDMPNFENYLIPFALEEHSFRPGRQVPLHSTQRTFLGFRRERRGVGTRNYIVVLGTSSRSSSFARSLAEQFGAITEQFPHIDGVVAVAHTEGGGATCPNNSDVILRALAGFTVHPNVAAVLAVDDGAEPINNERLRKFVAEHGYPIDALPHHFISIRGRYAGAMDEGAGMIRSWLEGANGCRRTPQSVAHLRVALQCGGSDAFSGISGNPLAGWVAKETIRYGGAANLAETDELMGAEAYILQNVRNLETARQFLRVLERFQLRAQWHGHDAEGNPSGGNNLRGLYNIALKSIGAARKKDPEVCLDYVIDYGERMDGPGFYFMDSPGNDLESIAGQVASGCNLILFTTGNGSVTNFPFVPTIKIMTNTGRYNLLTREMDVNAGRYQDGHPMEELGAETFDLAIRIASGERSAGEKAGHSQVQLWREWRQKDGLQLRSIRNRPAPTGAPIVTSDSVPTPVPVIADAQHKSEWRYRAYQTEHGIASDQLALIVPTSLCSGQIARLIAERLNSANMGIRFLALPHTEGCGVSGGECEELLLQTLAGYLTHPFARRALLLEHGCEKTHNQALQNFLDERGVDRQRFGWASVQLDGGIEKVSAKIGEWFSRALPSAGEIRRRDAGLESLRVALLSAGPVPLNAAAEFAALANAIVAAGGTVIIPENATLLNAPNFWKSIAGDAKLQATIGYGQPAASAGLHLMHAPTDHWVELLTGLGATWAEIAVAYVSDRPLQGHPMLPLIQVSQRIEDPAAPSGSSEFDLLLEQDVNPAEPAGTLLMKRLFDVLNGKYCPRTSALNNTDFQMTRGLTGFSL